MNVLNEKISSGGGRIPYFLQKSKTAKIGHFAIYLFMGALEEKMVFLGKCSYRCPLGENIRGSSSDPLFSPKNEFSLGREGDQQGTARGDWFFPPSSEQYVTGGW